MSIIKKTFFTSLVVLILTLLFWGVYNLSFPKNPTETKKEETPSKENPNNEKNPSKISVVSEEAALSPTITPDDKLRYYLRSNGHVQESDLEGNDKKTLSSQEFSQISNVFWSKDSQKSIVQVLSGQENKFFYFNFQNGQKAELKKNLDEVAWQESGNRIFYKYYSPETKERSLNVADPDGSNWKKLTDLKYRNVVISGVPKTSLVSFWNKADSFTPTTLETMPIIGGERKTIFKDSFGADYLWDNSGNQILVSNVKSKGGSQMQLGVTNSSGGEYKNLNIPTFVSKCVWSKNDKSVFYALPAGLSESAVFPNEYQEGKVSSVDTFWKINVKSGEKERLVEIGEMNQEFDATNLVLSSDESYLFFINKIDGKLYRINL